MDFFIFLCFVFIIGVSGQVTVTFDNKEYEACTSSTVEVIWDGYHNIQETTQSGYSSCSQNEYIGGQIVSYHSTNHKETLNIGATEGSTRYFICSSHCSSNKKFKIYCSSSETETNDPLVTTTTIPTPSTTTKQTTPSKAFYKSLSIVQIFLPLSVMTLFLIHI